MPVLLTWQEAHALRAELRDLADPADLAGFRVPGYPEPGEDPATSERAALRMINTDRRDSARRRRAIAVVLGPEEG